MLYKYFYVRNHKAHKLHKHFLYFLRKIKSTNSNSNFIVSRYFHPNFQVKINDSRSKKLKDAFKLFFNSYKVLDENLKREFDSIIIDSLGIETYFEDISKNCEIFNNDNIVRIINNDSFKQLLLMLYKKLSTWNIWEIDKHYLLIYNEMPSHKSCPFCGINQMSRTYKPDYDHIAYKAKYPIFAINLKNLVPMCSECNQKNKKQKDVFYKDNLRRPFAYPYSSSIDLELDFSNSIIPDTDITNQSGKWKVKFLPNNNHVKTWNDVFEIEKRYIADNVSPKFDKWTYGYFIDDVVNLEKKINDFSDLKKELKNYSIRFLNKKLEDSNIIWGYLFLYLAECNNDVFYKTLLNEYNRRKAA
jgi:5-methylcytosine-specific restriction endonuclease McrA